MAKYELSGDENKAVLSLKGVFNIDKAELLKAAFLEALTFSKSVEIDLDELEDIDLAGLQVFCSAIKTFASSGRSLSLPDELPQIFVDTANRAGFKTSIMRMCAISKD